MAIVIVRKWEMPEKFYFSGNLINQTENLVETFFYNFWRDVSKNGMSYIQYVFAFFSFTLISVDQYW